MRSGMPKETIEVELIFKINRPIGGISPNHGDIGVWETLGVGVISLKGQFDNSTTLGRRLLNLLESLADYEPLLIQESDGEDRKGVNIGRPRVTDRAGFDRRFGDVLERLNEGDISRRQAAKELKIGHATLNRLLQAGYPSGESR